jgi:triosephosphate isomerase
MNEKWVIGNWKMNLGLSGSLKLAKLLSQTCKGRSFLSRFWKKEHDVHIVVSPSFSSLYGVARMLENTDIALAGQNMFWAEKGAYTGEVSPLMLTELGCDYVIIGHSERRLFLSETDSMVGKKLRLALECRLIPILCLGETAAQRDMGQHVSSVLTQIAGAFGELKLPEDSLILIAYEPVWAIGTGVSVQPNEVTEMLKILKQTLYDFYDEEAVNKSFRFLYGGSVTEANVASFTEADNIDGVLVGGASLKSREFLEIIHAVRATL